MKGATMDNKIPPSDLDDQDVGFISDQRLANYLKARQDMIDEQKRLQAERAKEGIIMGYVPVTREQDWEQVRRNVEEQRKLLGTHPPPQRWIYPPIF
jgi:hypothetical protein